MPQIGILHDPRYLLHDTGAFHPERPDRLRAIEKMLDATGLRKSLQDIPARPATAEEILWVHDPQHLEAMARTAGQEVYLDADTIASPRTYEVAMLAVGGLLEATERVFNGDLDQAFAFVRPPGHHAERERAMGFCIFNNIAIAAEYLIRRQGLQRVAIVDFDVHHGNGTQHSFYERKDVFYCSTHHYPFYPGTGAAEERGRGEGLAYTLNVPLPAASDDEVYRRAFADKILPALRDYRPEFLLISAGFDAHIRDPLGGMRVSDAGFRQMAEDLQSIAREFCQGKVLYVLEGGYDLEGLAGGVREVLKTWINK